MYLELGPDDLANCIAVLAGIQSGLAQKESANRPRHEPTEAG